MAGPGNAVNPGCYDHCLILPAVLCRSHKRRDSSTRLHKTHTYMWKSP